MFTFYPIVIRQSRYSGVYEGGKWHAIASIDEKPNQFEKEMREYDEYLHGDDCDAVDFWMSEFVNQNIGIGDTPNDALYDLIRKLGSGSNIGETIAMAIPTFPYLPD